MVVAADVVVEVIVEVAVETIVAAVVSAATIIMDVAIPMDCDETGMILIFMISVYEQM